MSDFSLSRCYRLVIQNLSADDHAVLCRQVINQFHRPEILVSGIEVGGINRVRSRQCQGFPRNPGRFHPGSGLSPSLDQLGAIEREASFLVK